MDDTTTELNAFIDAQIETCLQKCRALPDMFALRMAAVQLEKEFLLALPEEQQIRYFRLREVQQSIQIEELREVCRHGLRARRFLYRTR